MRKTLLVFLVNILYISNLFSQNTTPFSLKDFDLKGDVKQCMVLTDYGKEIFEFNEEGLLVQSSTQYNEDDKDVTYYKLDKGVLLEKRMESIKNGVLDETTSMAHFYTYDSLQTGYKILERIMSYDKEFVEEQHFIFNDENLLEKIVISNQEGVDEKAVEYQNNDNGSLVTYINQGSIEKTIKKELSKDSIQITLTTEFIDGQPSSAIEERTSKEGKLLASEEFFMNFDTETLESLQRSNYVYNNDKVLQQEVIKRGNSIFKKDYIFQFDNHQPKNWVKKIITPDNTYVTRRILYFSEDTENAPQD